MLNRRTLLKAGVLAPISRLIPQKLVRTYKTIDYADAHELRGNVQYYMAYLNGKKVDDCMRANAKEGWVDIIVKPRKMGHLMKREYGDVVIVYDLNMDFPERAWHVCLA